MTLFTRGLNKEIKDEFFTYNVPEDLVKLESLPVSVGKAL